MKCITTLFFFFFSSLAISEPAKKVAIIVPAEIQALLEITEGFQSELKKQLQEEVTFKIANTQGDATLLHATIQALREQNYDLIVPIGSNATAATLSLIKNKPVLSLASDLSQQEREALHPCNVAVVHDEIAPKSQLTFLHHAFPSLKKIVLFHSAADKIFPEVEEAKKAATDLGITIVSMMAVTLPDLQIVAKHIPSDTEVIFLLKDMQMVSATAQLAKIAADHKLLFMSSDEGSVKEGAQFALGVHERNIGAQGALLAASILQGKDPGTLPIVEMKDLTLFYHLKELQKMSIPLQPLLQAASELHYKTELF